LKFYKYQGTGNDFVMIDNRENVVLPTNINKTIASWCHRRMGIGADGVILFEKSKNTDFRMVYFNADGNPGSMCGNGGRCIIQFAKDLGVIQDSTIFEAVDGIHHGKILDNGSVALKMKDVEEIEIIDEKSYVLNTGSPHYIQFCEMIPEDVYSHGKKIRYSPLYMQHGINVNFIKVEAENSLTVATYERGVEDETYSCGTGVTAAAISYIHKSGLLGPHQIQIKTKGGPLTISINKKSSSAYDEIWLIGPAIKVFEGIM